jgi:hypothetical protein
MQKMAKDELDEYDYSDMARMPWEEPTQEDKNRKQMVRDIKFYYQEHPNEKHVPDFDYLMYYIWTRYISKKDYGYYPNIGLEFYENQKSNIGFKKLKDIIHAITTIAYRYGYNKGYKEMEKLHNDEVCEINTKHRDEVKDAEQKYCDHNWIKEWTWSCGGYKKCSKCGAIEDFYERD